MSSRIYNKDLAKFVSDYNFIPKKVKSGKDIRRYGRYIALEQSTDGFKIDEIIAVNDDIYYQIKFLSTGRQAVIPFEESFTYYELHPDKTNIRDLQTIINTGIPYYGSEIRYWFFINKINLSSDKFSNFKSLLIDSKHTIADNKLYCLEGTYLPLKDKYIDCKAILYSK